MSTRFRVLLGSMLSAALLAGCALEVSDQVEEAAGDVGTTQQELRVRPLPLPNPCIYTSCATGTSCEVQEGEAICVPRDGLIP